MSKNNNKLYNNLVNTLGVTKELVMEQVNIRVEDLLSKHLESKLNSNYIEKLILDRITEIVKAGFINRSWCSRDAFDDYVKNTINNILVKKT